MRKSAWQGLAWNARSVQKRRLAILIGCSLWWGCFNDPGTRSADAEAVDSRGSDSTVADDLQASESPAALGPDASSYCPESPPEVGDVCFKEGLLCEYHKEDRIHELVLTGCVDPLVACERGRWRGFRPAAGCGLPPKAACPPTPLEAAGKRCSPKSAFCTYEGKQYCYCSECSPCANGCPRWLPRPGSVCWSGDEGVWVCTSPNMSPGCPAGRPNIGAACATEGLACEYCDEARACRNGMWVRSGGPAACE